MPTPHRPARLFLRFALPLIVAGVVLLWWRSTSTPETPGAAPKPAAPAQPPTPPPPTPSSPSVTPLVSDADSVAPVVPPPAASPVAPALEALSSARERIDALVVTYAKESLPALSSYLTHQDPAVREAARDGFLQMGLTEGAAYLRAAADQIRDPREAVQLLDAADFLDLPSVPSTGGTTVRPVSPAYRERLKKEGATPDRQTRPRD